MNTLRAVEVILDHQSNILDIMASPVEGGVVGDDERNIDGGHNDDHVPQAFQISVVGKHELGLFGGGCFVFREWLV